MANASNLRLGHATYISLGFRIGGNRIFKFAFGVTQILAFLDTNMLV